MNDNKLILAYAQERYREKLSAYSQNSTTALVMLVVFAKV